MTAYGMKYTHPWNTITLGLGIFTLIFGAIVEHAPDWDVSISLIMAGFTYATAVPALNALRTRYWPLSILAAWWSIDGCYALYWSIMNPAALDQMRDVNWPASTCLYLACALVWSLPTWLHRRVL